MVIKRILWYLQLIKDVGICYEVVGDIQLKGYKYVEFPRDMDGENSISAHMFELFGGAIIWTSKK